MLDTLRADGDLAKEIERVILNACEEIEVAKEKRGKEAAAVDRMEAANADLTARRTL